MCPWILWSLNNNMYIHIIKIHWLKCLKTKSNIIILVMKYFCLDILNICWMLFELPNIKCYKYINLIYVNAIQYLLFSSSFQFNIIALTSQNMKYIRIIYDRKIHNIQILWSIQIYRIITYNNRAPIQIRNFCKYLLNRYDYVRKFLI